MARILVIEDDDDFRRMLNLMLRQAGYDVLEASNGNEGLLAYNSEEIDLVITDVFMPQKEGKQTVLELMDKNPKVKIIAISGGGSSDKLEYLDTIKDLGVLKTFNKPFDTKEFLSGVSDLLKF